MDTRTGQTPVPQRACRAEDCTKPAARHKTHCHRCRGRIRTHGSPHITHWTSADDLDVEIIAANRQAAPGMTRLEKRRVAHLLTKQGDSAREIARILQVSPTTVHRWRSDTNNGRTPGRSLGISSSSV